MSDTTQHCPLCEERAREIERLRGELRAVQGDAAQWECIAAEALGAVTQGLTTVKRLREEIRQYEGLEEEYNKLLGSFEALSNDYETLSVRCERYREDAERWQCVEMAYRKLGEEATRRTRDGYWMDEFWTEDAG